MAQQSQQQQGQQSNQQKQQGMKVAQEAGSDPWLMAAVGSVALSWYYFFVQGKRDMGQFVGLWPPTVLAFASYFRQTDMHDKLKRVKQ